MKQKDYNFFLAVCCTITLTALTQSQTPYIAKEPKDVSVVIGEDVILPCIVENLPIGSIIQWTKGDFGLGFDKELSGFPRYSVIGDESLGEYNLLIKNTTIADEDDYECQVTSYRMRTKTARVTVQVPPKGPEISDVVNDVVKVRANAANVITCRSWNGKPAADLKWYKDGIEIIQNVTRSYQSNTLHNVSATLRIWPNEQDDGQRYYCVMSTNVITADQDSPVITNVDVTINVQKPPMVQISVTPTSGVMEGENVSMFCDASGSKSPAHTYVWYLNGDVIPKETKSRLTFKKVFQNKFNGAKIGCQAVNAVGASFISSTTLNVLYQPKILVAPVEVSANVNETATFYCEWDSNPVSHITWYRLGKQGEEDAVLGVGNTLTMNSVQQSDAGKISCVADVPGVGRNEAKTNLVVWGKPIISSDEEQFVKIGEESAVVECRISSEPGIQNVVWMWLKSGKVYSLPSNNTLNYGSLIDEIELPADVKSPEKIKYESRFEKGDHIAQLLIYDVTQFDMVMYNCSVINSYGEDSRIIKLKEATPTSTYNSIVAIVIGVSAGLLLVIVSVVICVCCCKNYQHKSTTLQHYKESSNHIQIDANIGNGQLHSSIRKVSSQGAESDNRSTTSSLSSPDGAEDVFTSEIKRPTQNDDGYYTEEANSWNRVEKSSPVSSPARSDFLSEQAVPLLPVIASSPVTSLPTNDSSPYCAQGCVDPHFNIANSYPQNYEEPNFISHSNNDVVDLPQVQHHPTSNMYLSNPSYSSLGRNSVYPATSWQNRKPSNEASTLSYQRSAIASPYAPQQYKLGRHTPILGERYLSVAPQYFQESRERTPSQSSLEQASSLAQTDPFDNTSKISHVSSRLSHASKTSDMFQRMTARMATHV